nr:hypothetical protein [Bacteroidota bacterium]
METKQRIRNFFVPTIATFSILLLFNGCWTSRPPYTDNCDVTGSISVTTAGSGNSSLLGIAHVCVAEQVKLIWNFKHANSVTLKIGSSAVENVSAKDERVITVNDDIDVDMVAKEMIVNVSLV